MEFIFSRFSMILQEMHKRRRNNAMKYHMFPGNDACTQTLQTEFHSASQELLHCGMLDDVRRCLTVDIDTVKMGTGITEKTEESFLRCRLAGNEQMEWCVSVEISGIDIGTTLQQHSRGFQRWISTQGRDKFHGQG
jgi:hypothetical protein